jgi:hypothetical protein
MRAVRCVTRERSEGKIKRLEASKNIGIALRVCPTDPTCYVLFLVLLLSRA